MWGGVGGRGGSEITTRVDGIPGSRGTDDVGPFLLLGARVEVFPAPASPVGRHFGFAFDLQAFGGETSVSLGTGPPREAYLSGAAVMAWGVVRFQGRQWEAHLGAGTSLLWATRLGDIYGVQEDDTDVEVPLGLSVMAGARWNHPNGWFLLLEIRQERGENTFEFERPRSVVDLDWRMNQFVIGTGYRF